MGLYDVIRAGRVTRWHSNPDMAHLRETNAEHQWMVAMILLDLWPHAQMTAIPPALLGAALAHDLGEVIGDLPGPFKAARPDIASLHAQAEAGERLRMGVDYYLTPAECRWLDLADKLAGWVHVAHYRPDLLARADWQGSARKVLKAAAGLGCCGPVGDLMRQMTGADPGYAEAAE